MNAAVALFARLFVSLTLAIADPAVRVAEAGSNW